MANGVKRVDFNSYGSRRGNHEVMMRGTFANVRIKNLMLPPRADGTREEGGVTLFQPSGEKMFIYDAAMKYVAQGTPTVIFGGEEYGTGSSRDWAAKGTQLLGVKRAGYQLRTWGDGYGYAMVACGGIEAMVDPEVSLWDIAPMPVIIGEAGGRFSTLDGSEPDLAPGATPSFVATNGRVHDAVVRALSNTPA